MHKQKPRKIGSWLCLARVYEKVVGKREEKEYPHLQTQQDGESREELPTDGNE